MCSCQFHKLILFLFQVFSRTHFSFQFLPSLICLDISFLLSQNKFLLILRIATYKVIFISQLIVLAFLTFKLLLNESCFHLEVLSQRHVPHMLLTYLHHLTYLVKVMKNKVSLSLILRHKFLPMLQNFKVEIQDLELKPILKL